MGEPGEFAGVPQEQVPRARIASVADVEQNLL
jgi:hypothetical protein